MAKKAISEMNKDYNTGKPFFHHWMTVSNHRPFTYPEGKIDIPADSKSRKGGVKYTDYSIMKFLSIVLFIFCLKNSFASSINGINNIVFGSSTSSYRSRTIKRNGVSCFTHIRHEGNSRCKMYSSLSSSSTTRRNFLIFGVFMFNLCVKLFPGCLLICFHHLNKLDCRRKPLLPLLLLSQNNLVRELVPRSN